MKAMLDFLEWHKEEYGHSYNHEMDLITSAKKASRYAEYYHKAKVEAISDEDIITLIKWVSDRGFDNIHAMDIRRQYKIKIQQLLKQQIWNQKK